jgi:hypothetical protein
MNYTKARNIWRNNFPKYLRNGLGIVGGVTFGKFTMPKQKVLNITREMQLDLETKRGNKNAKGHI